MKAPRVFFSTGRFSPWVLFILFAAILVATRATVAESGWAVQTSNTDYSLRTVAFTDANNGHIVGLGYQDWAQKGIFLKTTNTGSSWSQYIPPGLGHIYSVSFPDETHGWAIGMRNIFKTTNAGANWTSMDGGFTYDHYAVCFPDTLNGWGVGGDGQVVATTDGGVNWSYQSTYVYEDLFCVHFINSTTGWFVGDFVIMKTTNGGSTWVEKTTGAPVQYKAVHFPTAATGWVVGQGGVIKKSTAGGTGWSQQTSNTTATLMSVYFVNENTGWAVGTGGTVLHTTDGGALWSKQTTNTDLDLYDVYFLDENRGWIVGDSGLVLQTTTGGVPEGGEDPSVIWSYDASSEIKWFDRWEDGFATGDLNDDGKADVVCGTTAGEVIALNSATGSPLWKDTIPSGTEYTVVDIIDVEGDGLLDVVAGGKVTSDSALIVAYNKNGTVKWSTRVGHPEVADCAYGDIDGDGHKDVVAAIGKYPNSGGAVALLDGRDGSLIWEANLGSGIAFGIDAKDMDSDGDMEVAVTNYDSKVFLIDGRSDSVLWSKGGIYYGRDVIIENIDDRTGYEVVSVMGNVYCYNDTGKLDWVVSPGIGENLTPCNPNEDDTTDILVADPWNGRTALAIGRNGRILWTRSEAGAAGIGDLNGDGDVEIVVGSLKWYSPDFSAHHLRAVDSQNNLLWEYDLDIEPTAVVVADIDADNKDEVLYTAGSELVALNVDIFPLSVEPVDLAGLPTGYDLMQNYPNPFNPITTIQFALPHAGFVTLKIYSVVGEEVATLVESKYPVGTFRAEWDATGVASGVYIYRMVAGNYSETRKMVLIR